MTAILVEPVAHIRPGKAQVYLDPRTNARLRRAEQIAGSPIYPTGSGSAGRTYDQQAHYWNIYQQNGFPIAANPDKGRRPHMRFAGIDVWEYDKPGVHEAMIAAGFVLTTKGEPWHYEDPDMYRSRFFGYLGWPIVTSIYLAPERKETAMPILVPLVVGNPATPNGDYAIIGDGGIVGLRANEDKKLITIAKRAMLEGLPIYGAEGDQLQALFARVAVKPVVEIDYARLAVEVAKVIDVPTVDETAAAVRKKIIAD